MRAMTRLVVREALGLLASPGSTSAQLPLNRALPLFPFETCLRVPSCLGRTKIGALGRHFPVHTKIPGGAHWGPPGPLLSNASCADQRRCVARVRVHRFAGVVPLKVRSPKSEWYLQAEKEFLSERDQASLFPTTYCLVGRT